MEITCRYRCDFGHAWEIRREQHEEELPEHTVCPEGHPAVTCLIEEPADRVQLLLHPAALVPSGDITKYPARLEHEYWLVLLDRNGQELARSSRTYEWDALMKLIPQFAGRPTEEALQQWKRRNP